MVNGFTEMIAGSLKIEQPWYVEGAEFLPEKQELHIFVKVRENAVFACPVCEGATVRNGPGDTPRAKAAEILRCDEKSLAAILSFWVGQAVTNRTLDDVKRLASRQSCFVADGYSWCRRQDLSMLRPKK